MPSHCIGQRYFRLLARGGGGYEAPWDGPPNVVLTARVPDGPNRVWRIPLLSGHAYLMSELS
jgi:hypothetical protein